MKIKNLEQLIIDKLIEKITVMRLVDIRPETIAEYITQLERIYKIQQNNDEIEYIKNTGKIRIINQVNP